MNVNKHSATSPKSKVIFLQAHNLLYFYVYMFYLVLFIDIDILEGFNNLKVYTMFCLYLYLEIYPM